ncbi:MAG: hypothetical protein GY699_13800 [Desulfobacteraceae bacterium]|nr:hypothetical protein [Desulfobacteraceae bacterium]
MKKQRLVILIIILLLMFFCIVTVSAKTQKKSTSIKPSTTIKNKQMLLSARSKSTPTKKGKKITPKMVKKNKKAILQFPVPVKNLVIRDRKNQIVQNFKKGKEFDITKIVKKGKGKRLETHLYGCRYLTY